MVIDEEEEKRRAWDTEARATGVVQELQRLYRLAHKHASDPAVRDWAINAVLGRPRVGEHRPSPRAQAIALLAAFKKLNLITTPNPPTEAELLPAALLSCGAGAWADADDAAVAFAAAAMSIGIGTTLVGHSYTEDGGITHVVVGVFDGGRLLLFDPHRGLGPDQIPRPTREIMAEELL